MKRTILILCFSILIWSCEGVRRIHINNFSDDIVKITTSMPKSGLPEDVLFEYPNFRLEPSKELSDLERIDYYKNLFNTKDSLFESEGGIVFFLTQENSLLIGGHGFILLPGKVRSSDLYIDTLTLFLRNDTIKACGRDKILELTKDKRFKNKSADRQNNYRGKQFKNIVIR